MSEIRVTTLKDTSGGNSSTTAQIASGRAKAWVNFNGSSAVAMRSNFNVNSISDNGEGDYTVNFSTALADANYAVTYAAGIHADQLGIHLRSNPDVENGTLPTSSAYRFKNANANGSDRDVGFICLSFFR